MEAGGEEADENDVEEGTDDELGAGRGPAEEELDVPAAGVDAPLAGVVRDGEDRDIDLEVVVGAALLEMVEEADVVDEGGLDDSDGEVVTAEVSAVVPEALDEFTRSPVRPLVAELEDEALRAAFANPTSSVPLGRALDQPTVAPTMAATMAATVKPRTDSRGPLGLPPPSEYDTTGEPSASGARGGVCALGGLPTGSRRTLFSIERRAVCAVYLPYRPCRTQDPNSTASAAAAPPPPANQPSGP